MVAQLQTVLDQLPTGVIVMDPQGRILRVGTSGMVHRLLTSESDFEQVDARHLVERVVPTALRNHTGVQARLDLHAESVPLASKQATALALILNEQVSNAAKHAFRGRHEGRLLVHLTRRADGVHLLVEDDGPGLPPGFDPGSAPSERRSRPAPRLTS